MKTPIKQEFWIEDDGNTPTNAYAKSEWYDAYNDDSYKEYKLHVVSAEWAEAEIQRLKEALREARENLDHTQKCHHDLRVKCQCHYENLISKIDEVLKDE